MSIPYATASSGERALAELQRILAKFGCQAFGTMVDVEKGCTIVQFRWRGRTVSLEANWRGYAAAFLKDKPYSHRMRQSRAQYEAEAFKQAQSSVCSVLRDWVKGQVTAVECGIMSFEAVFMPHMLLGNGKRLIDHVNEHQLLPAPDEEKVVDLKTAAK